MDEDHLAVALRYVALNPVRARLVERAEDWRWSSARAHLSGRADGVTRLAPVLDRFPASTTSSATWRTMRPSKRCDVPAASDVR